MGLPYELAYKFGAKYIMTVNIDTEDGLVNGAVGILKHVDYNTVSNSNIPTILWIHFQINKTGRKARSVRTKFLETNWTPVTVCVRTFRVGQSSNINIDRKQFSLVCAEAITIYKSQGGTYSAVALHTKKGMERAAVYVACSRATTSNGLYIVSKFVPPLKMSDNENVKIEMDRIKIERPLIPTYLFLTKCTHN